MAKRPKTGTWWVNSHWGATRVYNTSWKKKSFLIKGSIKGRGYCSGLNCRLDISFSWKHKKGTDEEKATRLKTFLNQDNLFKRSEGFTNDLIGSTLFYVSVQHLSRKAAFSILISFRKHWRTLPLCFASGYVYLLRSVILTESMKGQANLKIYFFFDSVHNALCQQTMKRLSCQTWQQCRFHD